MNHQPPSYRDLFVGLEIETPLLDGSRRPYINLDNAASTPPLKAVQRAVDDFLPYYSSVHRGTGFKSQLSTHYYEQARQAVIRFLGGNPAEHVCIFGKNTTEAINKLARRFPFTAERSVVLTSGMEHHSNDLPWRHNAQTVHIALLPDGRLDETDYQAKLETYRSQVALVAITGASNVTGYINDIHGLAEQAHAAGAHFLADCAQLAPHRQIEMGDLDDPGHLDYVAISAHKMYAPFGTGALVGRQDVFQRGDPDLTGGGTVEIVTLDEVFWAAPPDRDEAGSPNTIGAIALAAALGQLSAVGMPSVAVHEAELTAYILERLAPLPGIRIFGDANPENAARRLGVIPLQLDGISHFKAAAILGYEFGIGVRSGCFCAHPYILHLLGLDHEQAQEVRDHMLAGDRSEMPGMLRVSFGLYNTPADVDRFIDAVQCILAGQFSGNYRQEVATGEYKPLGWQPKFEQFYSLMGGISRS